MNVSKKLECEVIKMMDIAANIRSIIKNDGLKQCAVAHRAGLTPKEFNALLTKRKTFKAEYIVPICNALNVTPNELLGVSGTRGRG